MMNEAKYKNNNQDSFQIISELLREEIEVHERMISLLKVKQKAIIKDDVSKLREYMQEEQTLIQTAKSTMKMLEERVTELKESKTKAARLEDIIPLAPHSLRDQLDRQRKQLRANIEKLSRINRENRYLLNHSLEMIKGMVQIFLRGNEEPIKLYNVKGHVSSSDNNNKLLNFQI